jgi:hypothetical protein
MGLSMVYRYAKFVKAPKAIWALHRSLLICGSVLTLWSEAAAQSPQWILRGTSDCGDHDVGRSDGAIPDSRQCNAGTIGLTAVCFNNNWCTYKSTRTNQCVGGATPGAIYQCSNGTSVISDAVHDVFRYDHFTQGGFVSGMTRLMDTPEAEAVVTAACIYATGGACAPGATTLMRKAACVIGSESNSTADEWGGAFRAPDGYRICRADINMTTGSITGNATFTATIQDNNRQLAHYSFAQRHGGVGAPGEWADFMIYLTYVPDSGPLPAACMHDGRVWECGEKTPAPGSCKLYQGSGVWLQDDKAAKEAIQVAVNRQTNYILNKCVAGQ